MERPLFKGLKGFLKVFRGRDANKIISGGLKGFMKVLRHSKKVVFKVSKGS